MQTQTAERCEEVLADGAFSPGKAAAFSGFSRTALYNAMAANELPYFTKAGKGRLIAKRALIEWMSRQLKPVE